MALLKEATTTKVEISDVKDVNSLCRYAQQRAGVPMPSSKKDWLLAGRAIKLFFQRYPKELYDVDFTTLCKVVDWARDKNKRYSRIDYLLNAYRYAYADGHLPELHREKERTDPTTEGGIERALSVETDPFWRRRLIVARGQQAREDVLQAWKEERLDETTSV